MKLTKLDKLVVLIFVIHLATMATMNILVATIASDCVYTTKVIEYYESNPLARTWLNFQHLGVFIHLLILSLLFGGYFYCSWKYKDNAEVKEVLTFGVILIFFFVLMDFVNDLSMLVGAMITKAL